MKKLLAILLCLMLCFSLAACGGDTEYYPDDDSNYDYASDENTDYGEDNSSEDEQIISGTFTDATPFVDGRAVVKTSSGLYMIDKKGKILLKYDDNIEKYNYNSLCKNGLFICEKGSEYGFCDSKGKFTSFDEFDIEFISYVSIHNDYIVATQKLSTYDKTVNKIGILDTKLKWVVEPSEDLYNTLESIKSSLNNSLVSSLWDSKNQVDNYVYLTKNKSIDLSTGKISETEKDKNVPNSKNSPLENNNNIHSCIRGKAIAEFSNDSVKFFSIIDLNYNLLFDPIEAHRGLNPFEIAWDGEYIAVISNKHSPCCYTYDTTGKLLGEWKWDDYVSSDSNIYGESISISDGVVRLEIAGSGYKEFYYYDKNFEEMFPMQGVLYDD